MYEKMTIQKCPIIVIFFAFDKLQYNDDFTSESAEKGSSCLYELKIWFWLSGAIQSMLVASSFDDFLERENEK